MFKVGDFSSSHHKVVKEYYISSLYRVFLVSEFIKQLDINQCFGALSGFFIRVSDSLVPRPSAASREGLVSHCLRMR